MREFARAFYQSRAWKDCREAYRKSVGGLCESCLAAGIYTPGKVVHHRQPLTPDNAQYTPCSVVIFILPQLNFSGNS